MSIGLRSSLGLGFLLFVAACTAAATKDENAASSAAAETSGFTCSANNVAMPTQLPDVGTCINDTDGNGGTDGCNGWTKAGPYQLGNEELRSVAQKGAQLYEIRPDAQTLCLYLYRGDQTVSTGSLNGIHCYNTSTCDLCWWDGATAAGVKPTVSILTHNSTDNCSDCHRNGPLLPKSTLWEAVSDDTKALHQVCSGNGGPTWADPMDAWTLASPDTDSIVTTPGGCGGSSCHSNGFSSGGNYCAMINHAFGDENGSMRAEGKKFRSADDCTTFRDAMSCAATDLDCTSADIVAAASDAPSDDDDDDDTATTNPDPTTDDPADPTTDPQTPAGDDDDDDDDADAGTDDGNAHAIRRRHSAFAH